MSTIRDVAEKANVSITTVSHVVNGTRFVSAALKERVTAAMDALGYQPNGLARSLRMGQTRTIGLIVPDNSNLFFAEVARQIEDLGFRSGYSVILCNTDDDPLKETAYIDVLVNKQVDGIVFISSGNSSEHLKRLRQMRIPVVVADRDQMTACADVVMVDNHLGGCLAGEYLLSLGHSRVACIHGGDRLTPSSQRLAGFMQVLKDNGVEMKPEYIIPGDFHFQSGITCMDQLLDRLADVPREEWPTAVFICNDMMALGAIRAARKRHLDIPRDLSIVGFDNIRLTEVIYPALTTVAQPIQELAEGAINMLLKRMKARTEDSPAPDDGQNESGAPEAKDEYHYLLLKPTLVVRDLCLPVGNMSLPPDISKSS